MRYIIAAIVIIALIVMFVFMTKEPVEAPVVQKPIQPKTEIVKPEVKVVAQDKHGAELYKKCAGCHGKDGKTVALGKGAVIAGQPADELVKKLEGYRKGTYGGSMQRVMIDQITKLTRQEVKEVAAHISTL